VKQSRSPTPDEAQTLFATRMMMTASSQIGAARWVKVVALFAALLWTAYSGFRPGPDDSSKWYDRAIRAIGGLLVLVCMAYGFILLLKGN
jgi:hypothetical protein